MSSYGLEILSEDECFDLLRSRHLGRVSVSMGSRPAIFPVNYAMLADDVVFRTDPGRKLMSAVLGDLSAFEIDHAAPFSHEGWSVLVVGHAEEVRDRKELDEVEMLPLRPWASGVRDHVVRIKAETVTGRRIVHPDPADRFSSDEQ